MQARCGWEYDTIKDAETWHYQLLDGVRLYTADDEQDTQQPFGQDWVVATTLLFVGQAS